MVSLNPVFTFNQIELFIIPRAKFRSELARPLLKTPIYKESWSRSWLYDVNTDGFKQVIAAQFHQKHPPIDQEKATEYLALYKWEACPRIWVDPSKTTSQTSVLLIGSLLLPFPSTQYLQPHITIYLETTSVNLVCSLYLFKSDTFLAGHPHLLGSHPPFGSLYPIFCCHYPVTLSHAPSFGEGISRLLLLSYNSITLLRPNFNNHINVPSYVLASVILSHSHCHIYTLLLPIIATFT